MCSGGLLLGEYFNAAGGYLGVLGELFLTQLLILSHIFLRQFPLLLDMQA